MMFLVALCAAATDRLYIEDYILEAGDTCIVSILLDNESAYTAFQTDLYLPEGLSVAKEDDDYTFELTSRKSSDHIIMGQDRPNGSIRIMSYSMQVNPYSGNSGALVTFRVTASDDFTGGAVELKNTFFTTLDDKEIPFANETCQIAPLKDLTGEILITESGSGKNTKVLISYTGDEDVDYTIFVNGYDLLNDLSDHVSWDDVNKRYIVKLSDLPGEVNYINQYDYAVYFDFQVTIQASGYYSLEKLYNTTYLVVFTPEGPTISEYGMSDLSFFIDIFYDFSVHVCDLSNQINDDYFHPIYAVERLDHDHYITVTAGQKTPMMTQFGYTTKTFLVPARDCELSISKSMNKGVGQPYCIVQNGSCDYYGEVTDTIGGSFVLITCDGLDITNESISIDGQLVYNAYPLYSTAAVINLFPFGDIFGGEHHITATATDGYYSLTTDTVLEIHPVELRLTSDAMILDVASDINNLVLRVDGQEVQLSTGGQVQFYALERLENDYSVIVQAGVVVQNEWNEPRWFWTSESTIVVPAKVSDVLNGDVNEDGNVNISDVTALIDLLLSGDTIINDAADVNGDGNISINDVTALIDALLSGSTE